MMDPISSTIRRKKKNIKNDEKANKERRKARTWKEDQKSKPEKGP